MGAIKDIIDLVKDLESRAKERRDIDLIHKIQSLALSLQAHDADIVERDIRLMEENSHLKRQLAEAQSEDIRIDTAIEFRRGERTSGRWMPFCPKCHMPAVIDDRGLSGCSANCGWITNITKNQLNIVISKL